MAINDLFKTCNFKINLEGNKSIELFVQDTSIPGFSIGQVDIGRPVIWDKRPGDKIEFNDLMLTVLCDEDLKVYTQIYEYITMLSDPETSFMAPSNTSFTGELFLLTNKNNIQKSLVFYNCWIKSFDDIPLSAASSEDDQLTISLTISYTHYILK